MILRTCDLQHTHFCDSWNALYLYIERAFDKGLITELISEFIKNGIPAQLMHIRYTVI